MSRRKQAKPRAVIKSDDVEENCLLKATETPLTGGTEEISNDENEDSDCSSTFSGEDSLSPFTLSPTEEGGEDQNNFTLGPTESTPYTCQFCEKSFPRLSYLKKHEQSHSEEMPFECEFCNRLFKHKRSRDRHVKLHTGDRKYRCSHCESAFSRSDHLKIHMKTHDHQKPYQCVICNRGYNTAAALTSHIQNHKKEKDKSKSHHPSSSYKCLNCNKLFNTPEQLQSHASEEHPQPPSSTPELINKSPSPSSNDHKITKNEPLLLLLPCEFCRMEFTTFGELEIHRHSAHALSFFLQAKAKENAFCGTCAIAFPNSIAYAQHFIITHTNQKNNQAASFSGSPASSPPQLNPTDLSTKKSSDSSPSSSPNRTTTPTAISQTIPSKSSSNSGSGDGIVLFGGGESLLCNQCSAGFSDFESFRNHLKTHLDESIPKYKCEECEIEFLSGDLLESHQTSHYLNQTTEYGCTHCRKLYCKPDELQKHLLDLHAHHLFKCALCKEVFDSKVAIQVHFAVKHSNEARIWRCSPCGAPFGSEIEFQVHVKLTHLRKSIGFRCLLCSGTFGSEIELQFHISTHTKSYKCNICNEGFHVEFLLDKHNEKIHHTTTGNSSATSKSNRGSLLNGKFNGRKHVGKSNYKCEICDEGFQCESGLNNHRKDVHNLQSATASPPLSLPASLVPPTTTASSTTHNSNKHRNNGHSNNTLSLHCAYCNENCKSRTDLENHMKSHTGGKGGRQKCNICDEICPTPTLLAEHKLTHCKVLSGSLCSSCKQGLNSTEDYFSHMKLHPVPSNSNGGLPIPCIVCRQTLVSDIEIQLHAQFHTKDTYSLSKTATNQSDASNISSSEDEIQSKSTDRSYECIKCQEKFNTEAEIQDHVRSHLLNEGNSLKCFLCPNTKEFDSPLKLQSHLIEHSFQGSNSFRCFICSTLYTTSTGLQKHILSHGESNRHYECQGCSLSFFFRTELENHNLTHCNPNHTNSDDGHKKAKRKGKRKKFFYRSDSEEDEPIKREKITPTLTQDGPITA